MAGIPQATPVDLEARARALKDVPKQQYDQPAAAPTPDQPGTAQVPMRAEAKRASARALLRVVDRLQANIFSVVAKNEDPAMFRMTQQEFEDLSMDLEDGVATMNISIPWWVGFAIGMAMIMWVNWTRASKIRKERQAQEAAEARRKAQEAAGATPPAPAVPPKHAVLRKVPGTRPGPAPNMVEKAIGTHPCARPGCTALAGKGRQYCSTKCSGMHAAMKRKEPKVQPPAAVPA